MFSKGTLISSAALLLVQSSTASQLCQDDTGYDSTAIYAQYCYQLFSDEASASAVCDAIDAAPPLIQCFTLPNGDDYMCYCKTFDLDFDCPMDSPDYMAQETCEEGEDEWSYSDVESHCDDSAGEMANFANNCCSDGYSICEDYTSSICSSTSRTGDYEPTNKFHEICYEIYDDVDTEAAASALCSDDCQVGLSDLDGDGSADYYCICSAYAYNDDDPDACSMLSGDYDQNYQIYNCAADAEDNWAYDDATTECADASTADLWAQYADVCCASGQSVCEEGYCVSGESTVSTLVNIDGKRRMKVIPVSEVSAGDEILSMHKDSKVPAYSKVERVMKSPSSGDFYHIEMMQSETKHDKNSKVLATPHHTFPSCDGKKDIIASKMKHGDCLTNSFGEKQLVKSVTKQASKPNEDFTYTLKMKKTDVIFVGDVATHSQKLPKKMHSFINPSFRGHKVSLPSHKKKTQQKTKINEISSEAFEHLMKQKFTNDEKQKIRAHEFVLKSMAKKN